MNKSEAINELAAALALAQGEMKPAIRDAANPFFKSSYADLASVMDAIRGPFAQHGLSYVQLPVPSEREEVQVETVLLHSSGQWISSVVSVPVAKQDAHGVGSALTYCRRYGLQSMCGVASEDDDGNQAAKAKPRPTEEQMTPRAKPAPIDAETGEVYADRPVPAGVESPARTVKFVIAKANYATAGMTEPQMRASFDLVRLVNERYGKGKAEALLRDEFKVVSRSDLTEEQAEHYLIRLTEMKEAK